MATYLLVSVENVLAIYRDVLGDVPHTNPKRKRGTGNLQFLPSLALRVSVAIQISLRL